MKRMKTKEDLHAAILTLSPAQIHILTEMAEAMKDSIGQTLVSDSDILVTAFVDHFSNRLRMHHATHSEKFKKKAFEFAFHSACIAAGRKSVIVNDPTNPGADVIVDGVPFSLKTEAAASIHDEHISISKLMEARWIRECLTREDFARETTRRVVAHLEKYARILMLRAFTLSPTEIRYDLMEIPRELLLKISVLKPADFEERTENGSSRADVYVPEGKGRIRAFSVRLDGSVEKVTISGLLTVLCVRHGSWKMKTVPPEES